MSTLFNFSTTQKATVFTILKLINETEFLFGFGGANPWDTTYGDEVSDFNPPLPGETNLPSSVFFKKPLRIDPIVKTQCAELEFDFCTEQEVNGQKWFIVDQSSITRELLDLINPENIYFSCILSSSEIGAHTFRSVVLYADPIFKPATDTSKTIFIPSELTNPGTPYWVSYSTPFSSSGSRDTLFEVVTSLKV